jgi:polar amino acid transport system substrate-binding protein
MLLNPLGTKKILQIVLIGFLTFPVTLIADTREKIQMVSSNWYPYAYIDNGMPKGSAYQIGRDVLKKSQLPFEFLILPWARIYHEALNKDNYVVLGVGRTKRRENMFIWIGPLQLTQSINYFGLSGDAFALRDQKTLRLGVERDSFADEYISDQLYEYQIVRVKGPEQLLRMTLNGRLNLFLMSEYKLGELSRSLDIELRKFEYFEHAFTVTNYMALSRNSSEDIAKKLKRSYEQLKRKGKITLR